MLIGVIQKGTLEECAAMLRQLEPKLYDLVELRLDACTDLTIEGVASLPRPLPVLFTLRSPAEGGAFKGSEEERLDMIAKLMTLRPEYMDVEAFVDPERIKAIRAVSPSTRIVLSKHNFSTTPENLDDILAEMMARTDNAIYKLAVRAANTLDTLRMLTFCRKHSTAGVDLICISMGDDGESSRILGPVVHTGLSYCPVEELSAPGQMDARTLRSVYHVDTTDKTTAIYGLIGDPVDQSIGHLYYNECNARDKRNAIYVKWRLEQEQLGKAFPMLRELGVRGLSVTSPLKEAVMPYLTRMDDDCRAIGAANVLRFDGPDLVGHNTDGTGTLQALPESVHGKKMVILGANGAAPAILYAAHQKGAHVDVFNNSPKNLPAPGRIRPFSALPELQAEGYDILINALPFNEDFNFAQVPFLPGKVALDLSCAPHSQFADLARQAGCRLVDSRDRFACQAELQLRFWEF